MAEPEFTTEELATEEWRNINTPGYEGLYQVSNLGRVRSMRNRTSSKAGSILKPRTKASRDGKGRYGRVMLSNGTARKSEQVHNLVAIAFLGPIPKGQEVNHKDGQKWNARLSNLEYVTHLKNMQHAIATGLHDYDSVRGEKNLNAKLTDEKVKIIRQRLREGIGVVAIGREVDMPYQRVQEIRDGVGWTHVQLEQGS